MKKLATLILAIAMLLSMAVVPAMAEDRDPPAGLHALDDPVDQFIQHVIGKDIAIGDRIVQDLPAKAHPPYAARQMIERRQRVGLHAQHVFQVGDSPQYQSRMYLHGFHVGLPF